MIVLLPIRSRAQNEDKNFKVGERVEYKEGYYPREAWFQGTVVSLYPENKQVVVHWDPRPDYPSYTRGNVSMYEQGYSINDVRHIAVRTGDKAAGNPADVNATVTPANGARMDKTETARTQVGTGLMTKLEISGYLRAHAFVNGQPKNDPQVCKDLIEQIKRRGVKEQFDQKTDDLSPLNTSRCWYQSTDTNVYDAIDYNIGPPVTINWLSATWNMSVIGGTVDTARGDGYIYRKNESYAKLGFLTINGNGTYTWKVDPWDPPAKYLNGTWRNATKEEMGQRGGAGVVLQKAAEGADWIAFKYLNVYMKGDNIDVQHLQSRGAHRRIGSRR